MAVPTYTKAGVKAATPAKLNKDVFNVKADDHQLLKDAYLAYLANGRVNLAKTKTRGQVRGGGQKPWRQKGTGRARFGSSRNPIWEGGGVAFGPTGKENYSRKISQKAKILALKQALSLAHSEDRIKIIDGFEPKDGKTKAALTVLNKIGANGSSLVITETKTAHSYQSVANLPTVKLVTADYLNIYDILNADSLIITSKALQVLDQRLGGRNE